MRDPELTPWQLALEIPSAHGLASDTFAHLCGGPGGYALSTPEFFLLAREVWLTGKTRALLSFVRREGGDFRNDNLRHMTDPFHRWPHEDCNCWCIGVLAGDMVAAYRALVAIGGEREFVAWQDRRNGYRWRRTGPAFDQLLTKIHGKRLIRCSGEESRGSPAGVAGGIQSSESGDVGLVTAASRSGENAQTSEACPAHAIA